MASILKHSFPTLRIWNVVDATRFLGAWLRAGEGIGWLAAGTMPNSLYRMPLLYLFLTCVFCYSCSFLFLCVFVFLFCSHWSLVDVPLIFLCTADHVPDWQPRVLLGMVEARSVNVKKTTTTTTYLIVHFFWGEISRALPISPLVTTDPVRWCGHYLFHP